MASCTFSSSSSAPISAKTIIPPPLPSPHHPVRFTSLLPCDELSALGQDDDDGSPPVPDNLLSTPRMVRNAVYSFVNPEDQSKDAFLLSWNKEFAKELGVDLNKIERSMWSEQELDQLVKVLTGGGRKIPAVEMDKDNVDKGPREARPWAHCYGGHQFGYYAGQLGDGRAISLYETVNPETGESWELQLKGAGKTPYSRFADGYAVLRSSIREYLCAEAVATLDVASSRSLAIVSTETMVMREEGAEPGSIVCRVAPSWIRFGSFEIFHYRKDRKNLRRLADYVVDEVYKLPRDDPQEMAAFAEQLGKTNFAADRKESETDGLQHVNAAVEGEAQGAPTTVKHPKKHYKNRFAKMFEQVAYRTALMVSGWQAIGFCHGVMNTDNMSILGLTIDYGPYAFLDRYDPLFICNHSDSEGRYSFQQQPGICLWNLDRLALTLENLIGAQERVDDLEWFDQQEADSEKEKGLKEASTDIVVEILNKSFREVFLKDYRRRMNEKMGLGSADQVQDNDLTDIVVPALSWMDEYEVDYHQFYRALADYKIQGTESVADNGAQVEALVKALLPTPAFLARGTVAVEDIKGWLKPYHKRLVESPELKDDRTRQNRMNKVNPAFVLRNWVAQKVIERTTESVKKTRENSTEPDPDKDILDRVLWMCQHPFGTEDTVESSVTTSDGTCEFKRNDAGLEVYGEFVGPVPEWGQGIQCSCSS
ncbi:hypothetical protein FBU30_002871 [Linnemannia zychae]|nr:hypothetical protein FBU30_002871 [Linnemannia zychae]